MIETTLETDLQISTVGSVLTMSFLQGIPESEQLLLLGSGLFFLGLIFRVVRKATAALRTRLTSKQPTEQQQSEPLSSAGAVS